MTRETPLFQHECLEIKKVQRKPYFKKAMITWDDMEESEPQEDADVDMGLMAQSDDEEEVIEVDKIVTRKGAV